MLLALVAGTAHAQSVDRVEPPSWWIGMEWDTVEFMVYGKDLSHFQAQSSTLEVIESKGLESPNYLFVTAAIPADAQPGTHHLILTQEGTTYWKSLSWS